MEAFVCESSLVLLCIMSKILVLILSQKILSVNDWIKITYLSATEYNVIFYYIFQFLFVLIPKFIILVNDTGELIE